MKKSLIAAAALALLASTGAKAADIVTYQEQPVAAPAAPAAVNWNGVYVGGTIGGSWGSPSTKINGTNGAVADTGKGTISTTNGRIARKGVDPDAFIGGFYAGYNFQPTFLSNSFLKDVVFGVETDFLFNSGDSKGNRDFDFNSTVDGQDKGGIYSNYRARVRQKWNGATRIRAGYALGSEGRFLPYVAGGVSYADIQARSRVADGQGNVWGASSKTKTQAGWNIGAGIDYVPPILNDHLVLRAEYRYTDFGSDSYGKSSTPWVSDGVRTLNLNTKQKVDFDQNDFRVGVAYKF